MKLRVPSLFLSQRVRLEKWEFSQLSIAELGTLLKFVACQAVRTVGHKQCVGTQAGREVDSNQFSDVMLRQMWTILRFWRDRSPNVHFYTSAPNVGELYITGDAPVLVIVLNEDNSIWVPDSQPVRGITDLTQVIHGRGYGFSLALSPYVSVLVRGQNGGEPHLPPESVEPRNVRRFNELIRDQSTMFTLARDKESLVCGGVTNSA